MSKPQDISLEFSEAYKAIHESFWRFCKARAYGRMEANDLVHESLLVAHSKFDSLKDKRKLLSFMIGIAIRLLANDNRKRKEVASDYASNPPAQRTGGATETSTTADVGMDIHFLYEAIAQLPKDQGEAIILFEITGYSLKEIAEIQASGLSAVKQRLRRGRKRLKELLTELPITHPDSYRDPKTIAG